MSAVADIEEAPPKKASKMPLILGLILAIAGGGGGFMAVKMGILSGDDDGHVAEEAHAEIPNELPPLAFVELDPLIVSLSDESGRSHLRFTAQIEVPPEYQVEVESIKPRVVDVLNGYLRAVDVADLSNPNALARLRGQMLRRIQVVAGTGRVRDLLIMEFVLN